MPDLTYIHPMVVHFPIALLIVAFLAELAGAIFKKEFFTRAGFYLLLMGTIGVVAAYLSGNYAGEGIAEAGPLKQALESHEEAGKLTMWLVIAAAVLRTGLVLLKKYRGSMQWIAIALFLVAVLSIARTGHYGGELVFKHAAGVRLELGLATPDNQPQDRD